MSPPRFPAIEKKTIILNKMPEAELLCKILLMDNNYQNYKEEIQKINQRIKEYL